MGVRVHGLEALLAASVAAAFLPATGLWADPAGLPEMVLAAVLSFR